MRHAPDIMFKDGYRILNIQSYIQAFIRVFLIKHWKLWITVNHKRRRIAEMVKEMGTTHQRWCVSVSQRQWSLTILFLECYLSATHEGWHAMAHVPHLDSARLPRRHRGDCPLTQNNEIILGEVMLKMNHFLTIPRRRPGTFLLDLVVRSHPSSTIGQVEGFTHHRQSHAPARLPSPSKQKHMTESPPSNPVMTRPTPAAASP